MEKQCDLKNQIQKEPFGVFKDEEAKCIPSAVQLHVLSLEQNEFLKETEKLFSRLFEIRYFPRRLFRASLGGSEPASVLCKSDVR